MKQKARKFFTNGLCGVGPEEFSLSAPGPFKDFRQNKHCHIASYAIALTGDTKKLFHHCFLGCRITVIQLQCIWPSGKIRVPAICEYQIILLSFNQGIILRELFKVALLFPEQNNQDVPPPRDDLAPCDWEQNRASALSHAFCSLTRSLDQGMHRHQDQDVLYNL